MTTLQIQTFKLQYKNTKTRNVSGPNEFAAVTVTDYT